MRLGPITIVRTSEFEAIKKVIFAAWILHYAVYYDQTHDYSELQDEDLKLADALSRIPAKYSIWHDLFS